MKDKNGIEIRTGDVVEITGAYFKCDNGLYYVRHSEGDPDWCGTYYSLKKISKKGKISTAKYSTGAWPIAITTNDWRKRMEADIWNDEHAQIEVRTDVNRAEIAEHFNDLANDMEPAIERDGWDYGKDSKITAMDREIQDHYRKVADSLNNYKYKISLAG